MSGATVLLLDAGNLLFSKPSLNALERKQLTMKAAKIVEAYSLMGYQAVGLGPLDFSAGFDRLLEYRRAAKYPIVCANLLSSQSGEPIFDPYVIVQQEGVKIGVIGVLDQETVFSKTDPWASKVRITPVHTAVRNLVKRLRGQGCNVVVVLSSLEPKKLRLLAKSSPEVDVFLGGDPADKLTLPYTTGRSLIACSSQLGKYVGHVELTVQGRRGVAGAKHAFVAMKPEQRDDPAVRRVVDGYYKTLALWRRQSPTTYVKEAEEAVNLQHDNPVFVSADECRRCHPNEYAHWKTTKHSQALAKLQGEARSNMECLECHVTGFGKWGGFAGLGAKPALGAVQCEECHGPGSSHPATLKMLRGKEIEKACKRCHTKSRSPEFRLREYVERIACRPS